MRREPEHVANAETRAECSNCGAMPVGAYCANCGQKSMHVGVSVHDFLHEISHEFMHVDGKIVRTMQTLVTRPGMLTKDFLEGRRARYVSPVRLYLVWSALFFWMAFSVGKSQLDMVRITPGRSNPPGAVAPGNTPGSIIDHINQRYRAGKQRIVRNPHLLSEEIAHTLPKAAFVLMPFFALLVWLVERRRERFYIPHLYFSIHFHAFVFFLFFVTSAMKGMLGLVGREAPALLVLLRLGMIPYLYASLRRVYGGTSLVNLGKTTLLTILYVAAVCSAILLVILLSMFLV